MATRGRLAVDLTFRAWRRELATEPSSSDPVCSTVCFLRVSRGFTARDELILGRGGSGPCLFFRLLWSGGVHRIGGRAQAHQQKVTLASKEELGTVRKLYPEQIKYEQPYRTPNPGPRIAPVCAARLPPQSLRPPSLGIGGVRQRSPERVDGSVQEHHSAADPHPFASRLFLAN